MMDAVVEGEGQFLSVQGKAAASDAVGVSADHGADKASLVFVVHRVFKATGPHLRALRFYRER